MLTVRAVARRLGVHENTVRRWVKEGRLRARRLPVSGFCRFEEADVETFLAHSGDVSTPTNGGGPGRSAAASELTEQSRELGVDIAATFAYWAQAAQRERLAERIAAYNARVRAVSRGRETAGIPAQEFPELTDEALSDLRAADLFN